MAAPDQAVLLSLAAAWSIDAARRPFQSRVEAMLQFCLTNTTPEHWWVCTNDDGRVTALDLRAVQAGGEILSELRWLSALRYLDLAGNPLTGCLPAGWRDLGPHIQLSEPLPFCTD